MMIGSRLSVLLVMGDGGLCKYLVQVHEAVISQCLTKTVQRTGKQGTITVFRQRLRLQADFYCVPGELKEHANHSSNGAKQKIRHWSSVFIFYLFSSRRRSSCLVERQLCRFRRDVHSGRSGEGGRERGREREGNQQSLLG